MEQPSEPDPARHGWWSAMLLGAGIALALGGATGHPHRTVATTTVTAVSGPTCPDFGCGANHNQVLL